MSIKTAIIPVAGAGTRLFPSTTAIEKCMMPIYGKDARPIIDYVVEDCVKAGIMRIIFVTSEKGQSQLQNYFEDIDQNLTSLLIELDRTDKLEEERKRRRSLELKFEYIVQPIGHYGTAYPPSLARESLEGENQFALLSGDDFVYRQDGSSELLQAIKLLETAGTDHVIMGNPVDKDQGTKYGVLQINEDGRLITIDEKPPASRVPDNPAVNTSRYLLSGQIWPLIEKEMSRDLGNGKEHFITDVINQAIGLGQTFQVHQILGVYMDGGTSEGLLTASNYITNNPRIDR
jgi:UTP--glucose-1-phosphate uridylyltransferase